MQKQQFNSIENARPSQQPSKMPSGVQQNQPASSRPPNYDNGMEPDFTDRTAGVPRDLVPDWMSILLNENRRRIERVEQMNVEVEPFRLFINQKSVEYLFTICLRMRLSHDVMYLALEVYNKFMTAHVGCIYEMIRSNRNLRAEQKVRHWEKVFSTMSRQIALRTVSSIQIASKMHSFHTSLSADKARASLQVLGYAYTEESIRKSEIRVLATINWCGNMLQSPLAYLEAFLHTVFHINSHLQFDTRGVWEYALMIMDCIFIHSDEFYKRISLVAHGQAKHAPAKRIIRLEADYVLLSAGVICMACICAHGSDFISTVILTLQQATGIPSESISNFYTGIYQTIHDHFIKNPLNSWSLLNSEYSQQQQSGEESGAEPGGKRWKRRVTFCNGLNK